MKRHTFLVFFLIILTFFVISIKSVNALDSEINNKVGLVTNTAINSKTSYNLGQWAYSIFITYAILLVLGILYYKKKLPALLEKPIQFIFKFEVSQKVSLLILSGLIAIFIIFKIGNLQNPEEASFSDYQRVTQLVQSWNIFSSIHDDITEFRLNLHYISLHIFGNIRVIAFLETISLLIVTYLTTTIITKKRFAGIVSVVVLLQSSLFLRYSVSVTYDNLWTLFYLISLYAIYKKWYLSPISYVLSLLSKPLVAIYLPMTFFFIHRANIKTSKRKLIISYLGILVIIAVVMTLEGSDYNIHSLYFDEFRTGLMAFEIFMS
ncbi:MAG: hypothetical protein P4K92_04365, partial [Candidatus Nitrosotalea sp.]|nr:hypothetical protein [Candidatus Nitrosotalea sp.]